MISPLYILKCDVIPFLLILELDPTNSTMGMHLSCYCNINTYLKLMCKVLSHAQATAEYVKQIVLM